jgi:hypothetical protein
MNITDLLESCMCRGEEVNKSRHLNSFKVFNTDIISYLMFSASWELIMIWFWCVL